MAAVADAGRLAALAQTGLLDTDPEPAFDRLARLATRMLGVPIAMVSLVDADRQFFKSCVGLPAARAARRQSPLSHSFCQHVVASNKPLAVADARTDPLFHDHPAIEDHGVVAYLGIPLAVGGHVLGSFCAIDGEPRAWSADDFATMRDLAESVVMVIRLRAESAEGERQRLAAESARERAEVTLGSIGDGVIAIDAAGRVAFLNPAASSLCGWPREEAIGWPIDSVFAVVSEATGGPTDGFINRVLRTGEPAGWRDENVLVGRDGSRREVEECASPILVEGRIAGAVLTFREIGPRKAQGRALQSALDRLDAILAAGDIGTWDYDLATGVVIGDRNLTRIYGMEPEGSIEGPIETFLKPIVPEDREPVLARIAGAIEAGERYEAEFRIDPAGRGLRHVIARGRVRRNEEGRAVQLSGVVIDITGKDQPQRRIREVGRAASIPG